MFSKLGRVNLTAALCAALAALLPWGALSAAVAGPSEATFAGGNGKVAFYRNGDVWTMNADGTGATLAHHQRQRRVQPRRLARWLAHRLRVPPRILRDERRRVGEGQRMLTNTPSTNDDEVEPVICPNNMGSNLWIMNADGTGKTPPSTTTTARATSNRSSLLTARASFSRATATATASTST